MKPTGMAWLILAIVGVAVPAAAAERGYSITSFDRIRVSGPFEVAMRSGVGASARASGSAAGLDGVSVSVEDRTLIVRPSQNGWTALPGADRGRVTIAVTGPGVRAATLAGSGRLAIDRIRADRADLVLSGSGSLDVGAVEATQLVATVSGSGALTLAGKAVSARLSLTGSGQIEAAGLSVPDAMVASAGNGGVTLTATRTAKVTLGGAGDVTVDGGATCSVTRSGSGTVSCPR